MRARAVVQAADAKPNLQGVEAVTLKGMRTSLSAAEVEELRTALRGPLIVRSDAQYDQLRRVWNAAIDRRPALIARCLGAADVIQCVNFARSHDLLTSIRCGGHSSAGRAVCDDGLMIDLSLLRGVRVDPLAKTAQVAGGSLLGDLDRESQAFGLATTAGTVSHTGVGGLTLGGGMGILVRKFGLTIDNLESVDVVTADGRFRRASRDENPDLFWATRGGGGNFGVVTRFQFRLHAFGPEFLGADLVYDFSMARKVLDLVAELAADLADDDAITPILVVTPDGRRMVVLGAMSNDQASMARLLAPFRKIGPRIADTVRAKNYVAAQSNDDEATRHGQFGYIKSGFLPRLTPGAIDALIGGSEDWKLPLPNGLPLPHLGGAMARVPNDATAFGFRNGLFSPIIGMNWTDPAHTDEVLRWARTLWRRLEPHANGSYVNMHSADDDKRVIDAYGPNYARLVELKNKWDPTNFFRSNANVAPSRAT
jgi:FAD/FMN-containing dehydrogenase